MEFLMGVFAFFVICESPRYKTLAIDLRGVGVAEHQHWPMAALAESPPIVPCPSVRRNSTTPVKLLSVFFYDFFFVLFSFLR
jgi:hypothetical protein